MRCPGCCNPEMLSFEARTRRLVHDIVRDVRAADVEGISVLGGEPFAQAGALAVLAEAVRAHGLTVMIYTGFTLAELHAQGRTDPAVTRLLDATDLLVDGRYEAAQRTLDRRWIGSTNQQMHFLSAAYAEGDPRMRQGNTLELRLVNGEVQLNGWPALGARTRLGRGRGKAPQHVAAHRLDEAEGHALAVARGMMGGRWQLPETSVTIKTPRVALATAASELIGRKALQYMTEQGGHRERAVLRRGRRMRGRIWDAELNADFNLRYTIATERLWRLGVRVLPMIVGTQNDSTGFKRSIKGWLRVDGTDSGDWLVYLIALENIRRLNLNHWRQIEIESRLAHGSPLVALATLRTSNPEQVQTLIRRPSVRLVECLEDPLVEHWLHTLQRQPETNAQAQVWQYRAQVLTQWLDTLYDAQRLDLARGVMRLLRRWIDALSTREVGDPERAGLAAQRIRAQLSASTARETQQLGQSVGRIFALGDRLDALRREMAAAHYGDDRYEEAQLYLADYESWYADDALTAPEVSRQLSGVVR